MGDGVFSGCPPGDPTGGQERRIIVDEVTNDTVDAARC
jgi:hypothetical protein